MSWLSRATKKIARSGLVKAATAVVGAVAKTHPVGQAAFRVAHAAKQLGAKVVGSRVAKRQGVALNAALGSLANSKRPAIVRTPSERSPDTWIKEVTTPDLFTSARPASAGDGTRRKRRNSGSRVSQTKGGTRKSARSTPRTSGAARTKGSSAKHSKERAQALRDYKNNDLARESPYFAEFEKAGVKKRKTGRPQPFRVLPPAMRKRADRMKELAKEWRAKGKPGRWIDYVKANS